jgi:hypothetical protein
MVVGWMGRSAMDRVEATDLVDCEWDQPVLIVITVSGRVITREPIAVSLSTGC